jgi:DNA-binding response OmpR family regulator
VTKQNGGRVPTILVVEDEWMLRDTVCNHLREAGWNVYEAGGGEEALAKLDALEIDVVVTDIRLNGSLNGWDVGEACRRKMADFPVIYTTGLTIEPPRNVDGSLFFNKPYDPAQIRVACELLITAKGN